MQPFCLSKETAKHVEVQGLVFYLGCVAGVILAPQVVCLPSAQGMVLPFHGAPSDQREMPKAGSNSRVNLKTQWNGLDRKSSPKDYVDGALVF